MGGATKNQPVRTALGLSQQFASGEGRNFNYGNIGDGATVTDGGAIQGTFDLANRLVDFAAELEEGNEQAVADAQNFALRAVQTEASQRAADRNEIIRLALPFAAVAVIGGTYFLGKK